MKRVLVIGGGSIGERHVRCFSRTGRCETALCEVNAELRQAVAERYSLPQSFATLEEAIGHNFDAAVICTPAHLHVPMAKQLADAGVALLIEKPLSISREGVEELQTLIASRNVPVAVAYVMRQHPALAAMRTAILEERFGNPVQVVYVGGQHFPFYRPAYRQIYYTRHETGGGAIQDALTHMVNAAEWLVGPISRLTADAQHCVLDGVDVEDTAHLMTRHRPTSGSSAEVLGSFSLNQHQAVNESSLTVVCDRGVARFETHGCRWLSCTQPDSPWTVEQSFALERDDLFVRQAAAFLDFLDGRCPPSCSLSEADQTLKVNLAALQSVHDGKWVTL
ncbi:MAG: Gfo/Idh/MocA family oxidoreductase [Planctomycetaceae bacterium]|nr:Gfo/Idh/MocA family oxidoreductase [Planctomycetaceae bacterium]